MATAPCRSLGPWWRPAPTACASRRSMRRSRCVAPRIRAPILVLYPIPAAWASEAARRAIAISAGDLGLLDATLASLRSGRRPGSRRLRIELEVETGLGRGGFAPDAIVAAAEAIRASRDAVATGLWTHLQAPEDRERTDGQLRRFEVAAAALRSAGIRAAGPPCDREREPPERGGRSGRLRRRPPGPVHLRSRPRGARPESPPDPARRGPAPGPLPACPAGPGRRPAGGLGHQLRADVRRPSGPAGSRPCRSGTETAGRARSRTGRARWSAADGSRSWATWRWTR